MLRRFCVAFLGATGVDLFPLTARFLASDDASTPTPAKETESVR